MLARFRFWLYRSIVAAFTWLGFRSQKVVPLAPPVDGPLSFSPFAEAHPALPLPRLFEATSFPGSDAARLPRVETMGKLLKLVSRIAPRHTPPVPGDEESFNAALYPGLFRKAWATPPKVPATVANAPDLIAELAVRGPFASYLRANADGSFGLDLDWMSGYRAKDGLARPGGKAILDMRDGELATVGVDQAQGGAENAKAGLLAALNEDLTTFRHNVSMHLALLTSFALATTNQLEAAHPVRRLLHHCFNTVLIGNRELATAQLSGPSGFSATIFSHDAEELVRMIDEYLGRFDFWDFEPDNQFRNRGTVETPFAYPYRDNVMQLWDATRTYVESYLELYYVDDEAVAKDSQVASWAAELDRLVPNGVAIPIGGVARDWLTRLCATLIHVSTVEHDIVNNIVWNYSTLGWIIPTVVPLSGEPMDQRRAFDLIATLIGTWKPYSMLLTADVPSLALDDRAAAVMRSWIERMDRIQDEMAKLPADPAASYPANLNVSVSN